MFQRKVPQSFFMYGVFCPYQECIFTHLEFKIDLNNKAYIYIFPNGTFNINI